MRVVVDNSLLLIFLVGSFVENVLIVVDYILVIF